MFYIGLRPNKLFLKVLLLAAALMLAVYCGYARTVQDDPNSLDAGFRRMYNLDFPGAHQTFEAWQQLHPDDPLGAASNAAAYLFGEFERLQILELDLFTDNHRMEQLNKLSPDPEIKILFEEQSERIVQSQPKDLRRLTG